jgi:hypothetical protein
VVHDEVEVREPVGVAGGRRADQEDGAHVEGRDVHVRDPFRESTQMRGRIEGAHAESLSQNATIAAVEAYATEGAAIELGSGLLRRKI